MAEVSKKNKRATAQGATASGMIDAMEQDVELTLEQVKDAATGAIAAVEKKFRSPKTTKKSKSTKGAKVIWRKKK